MNIKIAKKWLREYLRAKRDAMPKAVRERKSAQIARRVIQSTEFKKAKVVAAYIPFGSEVDTTKIIETAWKKKKTVLIPICSHGFDKTYFVVYEKGDPLKKTSFGPYELAENKPAFPWKKIDLMLVPGLGFDSEGNRLGYGGGVYDRVLSKLRDSIVTCGINYSYQEIFVLPHEKFDFNLKLFARENSINTPL